MKRTQMKRGKPLKRTGFTKSGRKKKTALQKRKDKMDSPYWENKCHAKEKEWAHNSPCLVCGKTEAADGVLVAGHHLLRKSRSRLLRWEPLNVIALCEEHHLSGIEICAHSDNPIAVAALVEAVRRERPDQYAFMRDNAHKMRQKDMRVGPKEKPDWRAQYDQWCKLAEDAIRANCDRVFDSEGYGL